MLRNAVAKKRKAAPEADNDEKNCEEGKKSKQKAKRGAKNGGKLKSDKSVAELTPLLSADILSTILEMLLPREMLDFGIASKEVSTFITHELVIRSAVMAEKLGMAKKNKVTPKNGEASRLKCILNLIEAKTIYIPSPVRCLRLLCGRKCEVSGCPNAGSIIQSLGLFVCSQCSPALLRIVKSPHYNIGYSHWQEDCVAKKKERWRTLIQSQPFATPCGEPAGALVTMYDIENLILQRKPVNEYLSTMQDKPGFPSDERVKSHTDMYDRALKGLAPIDEERKLKMKVAQAQKEAKAAKTQAHREAKKDKILKIIADVSSLLEEDTPKDALSYRWDVDWKGVPTFRYLFVHELMTVMTRAPGKGTEAKKAKTAAAINQAFRDIQQSKLSSSDYSSLFDETALEDCLQKHLIDGLPGVSNLYKQLNMVKLGYLKSGKLFEAVIGLVGMAAMASYLVEKDGRLPQLQNRWRYNYSQRNDYSLELAEAAWRIVLIRVQPTLQAEFLSGIEQAREMYRRILPFWNQNLPPSRHSCTVDWVKDCIAHMDEDAIRCVENEDGTGFWNHLQEVALFSEKRQLR